MSNIPNYSCENDDIVYGALVKNCYVLGPGKRAVLWVQGCPFQCQNCESKSFHTPFEGKHNSPREIAEMMLRDNDDIEGITISGGEPFCQSKGLVSLINEIKNYNKNLGFIVYTGFEYEALLELQRNNPSIQELLHQIDLLIDGKYIYERDSGRPYVGSDNQRLLLLTNRYQKEIELYYSDSSERRIQYHFQPNGTMVISGVPSAKQNKIIHNLLD